MVRFKTKKLGIKSIIQSNDFINLIYNDVKRLFYLNYYTNIN